MFVFPKNFENILNTGANARGRMKKLAVFAKI
jgi:hypothetical protein